MDRMDSFYNLGAGLRKAADPFLPEEMRSAPQVQQPNPQSPQAPQSPTGGQMQPPEQRQQQQNYPQANTPQLDPNFGYDYRVTDRIIQQYVDAGKDPRFAIGMAANAVVESSLVPSALNDNEGAYGLFQWRNDRLDNLRAFADRSGKNIDDIGTQVAFSLEEMRGAERVAYSRITGQDPQSASDYARLIDRHWERSSGEARDRRAQIAASMYQDYYGEGGRFAGRGGAPAQGEMGPNDPMYGAGTTGNPADEYTMTGAQGFDPQFVGQTTDREAGAAAFYGGAPTDPNVDAATQPQSPPPSQAQGFQAPPEQAGGQSPTGGYLPQSGEQRDGILGLKDIFVRKQGEGDEEFTGRRQNMFLAAAEGFQMLSRGVKADFNTPVQMKLNERQRTFDRKHNVSEAQRAQLNEDRQERRLNRAQSLNEQQFNFATEQYNTERNDALSQREAIANIADDAGFTMAAGLSRAGATQAALDMMKQQMETPKAGDLPFNMSEESINAFGQRMTDMGRPDLATAVGDVANNPEAAELAYKEGIQLAIEGGNTGAAMDDLIGMIPNKVVGAERERLTAAARAAAANGSDTVLNSYYDMVDTAKESKGWYTQGVDQIVTNDMEQNQRVASSAQALTAAAQNAQMIGVNPNFDSGKLKGGMFATVAAYARDLGPAGEALAKILNVDDVDIAGVALLNALRNGQLGNLGQAVEGQLSNQEGDRLLSSLADGTLNRVEILALSQIMTRSIQAQQTVELARMKYLEQVEQGNMSFSLQDYEQVKDEAGDSIQIFERMGNRDRGATAATLMREYGVDEPSQLPASVQGTVVSVDDGNGGYELVPLFAELYGDEYSSYVLTAGDMQ